MIAFAQAQAEDTTQDPPVWDNAVLDEWRIPFGDWADQTVDWIDNNLQWLLDIIEWPFNFLITNLVDRTLETASWVVVVGGFFLLAWLVRNIKVAAFSAVALTICGLLGIDYWLQTAQTIGFIAVAVILCVIIGIPIGVACGRVDGVWSVVRPLLDAMQVVHSFVYMLPFIFFWGIGEVSATMVTMIFALPPLIRLTNLGIRQVPEDVVEAARAYGAPEWRVLSDVQLPLARPAIMTGVNQTLLLAISMLGIAAIMGAGGLGSLLFKALSNQDVALAASAGLAFFLVAVVLDRVSQRDDTQGMSLFQRIRQAWAHRHTPEELLPQQGDEAIEEEETHASYPAPVTNAERTPMVITAVGGLITVVSVFLAWSVDGGKISAFGRRSDESRLGESFNGLAASGGSWFGFVVLACGLFVVAAVIKVMVAPGRGPRLLTTDGAAIASLTMLITTLAYVLAGDAPFSEATLGFGAIVALVGGVIATAGALLWMRIARSSPLRPLSVDVAVGKIIGVSLAVIVLLVSMLSGWTFDRRADVVITPEIEAQIAEIEQEARDDPSQAAVAGAEIAALMATAQQAKVIITDGVSSDGARLGLYGFLLGLVALGTSLFAAGVFGTGERWLWRWNTITAGLGAGIASVGLAWIASLARSSDPNYVSGVGSFLMLSGGFFILASTYGVLSEFRRTTIYPDDLIDETGAMIGLTETDGEGVEELETTLVSS